MIKKKINILRVDKKKREEKKPNEQLGTASIFQPEKEKRNIKNFLSKKFYKMKHPLNYLEYLFGINIESSTRAISRLNRA